MTRKRGKRGCIYREERGWRSSRFAEPQTTSTTGSSRGTTTRSSARPRRTPAKCGIMIGNQIIALNAAGTKSQMNRGTFGCTATRRSDRSVVLLSNWHVLMVNGARNLGRERLAAGLHSCPRTTSWRRLDQFEGGNAVTRTGMCLRPWTRFDLRGWTRPARST